MQSKREWAARAVGACIFVIVLYLGAHLAVMLGVKPKPWFIRMWYFFAGGGVGATLGAVFALTIGAIGLVCGPLFGALGLFGLAGLGALGGIGVAGLANVILHPAQFNFNYPALTLVMGTAAVAGWWLSSRAAGVVRRLRLDPPGGACI